MKHIDRQTAPLCLRPMRRTAMSTYTGDGLFVPCGFGLAGSALTAAAGRVIPQ